VWCWTCGSEYRPGYRRCPDCDTPLLDATPPAAAPAPAAAAAAADRTEYDLAGWSSDQRDAAAFWLERMEIPAEWRPDGVLVVPSAREIQVDDLLDSLVVDETEAQPAIVLPDSPARTDDTRVLAGPGRRFAGFLIDYVVVTAAAVFLYLVSGRPSTGYALSVAVDAAYFIGGTAIWGRTVGKLVLHTVVVRTDGVEPPGLRVAAIRWAIVSFAIPLGYLAGVGGMLSLGWTAAVFLPIFLPARRGIHDHGAGTEVLYRP
jgi:uncharacterized RDD family membrane protein YckC